MTQQRVTSKAAQEPSLADGELLEGEDSDNDYKDDDAPVAPPPTLQTDESLKTFNEIITRARNLELSRLGQKANRQEFLDTYGEKLVWKTQTFNQTLLHIIADTIGHKSLTRCIVRKDKTLLNHKDDSGRTALHIAIVKKNYDFLEVVLQEITNLDALLRMRCEHARNCIHTAIYHGLNQKTTLSLINGASEATLYAADQDGLTPLHLAVEYSRCSEAQLAVVQALLVRGNGALDKFTTNPKDLSVYEYHEYTRGQAIKKSSQLADIRGVGLSQEAPSNNMMITRWNDLPSNERAKRGGKHGYPEYGHEEADAMNEKATAPTKAPKKAAFAPEVNGRRGSTLELPTNTVADHISVASTPEEQMSPVIGAIATTNSAGFEPPKLERRTTAHILKISRRDEDSARRFHEDEKRRTEWADKIRQEFKLAYLRSTFKKGNELSTRDQLSASRFLHGSNVDNINLCFDYEAPNRVLPESFRQSFDHMSFDEILRYVSFDRVELQKPEQSPNESRLSKKLPLKPKLGRGREDLTFFFDWLYKKKVRHILKVTVDDLEEPSHSDKAIEESLRRFEVEVLDWRRIDLCPETLYIACRNVRELYLRWSGNRAVLRAWGEPEGLPRLAKLERVHLIWTPDQTLESADRVETYIEEFQERLDQTLQNVAKARRDQERLERLDQIIDTMHAARSNEDPPDQILESVDKALSTREDLLPKPDETTNRKILVYRGEENVPDSEHLVQSGATKMPNNTNERNLQSNRWLDCMDKFADEIQNVKIPPIDNAILKNDIKVALIDDGVDPYVESLRGKIRGGESFDRGFPHENGPSPYYVSTRGHGTVMADMICRVCPMAKLYVYKLETHSTINTGTHSQAYEQISASSAALAVLAAVNQKVDIISMSWTVKETEENHESVSQLREAIKLALDAGILLFCAAGDTGAMVEVEYPWSYDTRRIFRIGAAMVDGRILGSVGSPAIVNFILPGHKVQSRNPYREGALPEDFEQRTGSSIATALAAGLAALILHCVRLGAIHTELEERRNIPSSTAVKAAEFLRLKDHDNMISVLKAIGLDEGQQKFIEVWRRFDAPTQALKAPSSNMDTGGGFEGSTPGELRVIAKLARDFVSGISERIS